MGAILFGGLGAWVAAWAQPSWRDSPDHRVPEAAWEDPEVADPALVAAAFARARARLAGTEPAVELVGGSRPVWLCAYAPPAAPRCAAGDGLTLADAVDDAGLGLGAGAEVLKLDLLVTASDAEWPRDRRPHEAGTYGIAVGPAVILPSEVLERGLFRAPEEDEAPEWDEDAVRQLLSDRGTDVGASFGFRRLRTASWVQLAADQAPTRLYRLHPWEARDPGDAEVLGAAARLAAEQLAASVGADGRVRYRWSTALGRELPGDNLVRQAGAAYSLAQAWDALRDPALRDAAERAIGWAIAQSRTDERHGPYGGGLVRWLPETPVGERIHLGGAALAAVAIATWQSATGDERFADELRELALYVLSQQEESGAFRSYAPIDPDGAPRDEVSDFYPGEAVLALVLTAAVDDDPRWLEGAVRGAGWLAERDAGEPRQSLETDHWRMIALPHLYRQTGDDRWVAQALQHADALEWQASRNEGHEVFHRDFAGAFVGEGADASPPRGTSAATRSEGLAAVVETCAAAGVECPQVRERLERSLEHVLQAQYLPEVLYWMPSPELVRGAFAGGIVDPDVRDDYTQHALSAVLGRHRLDSARSAGRSSCPR